MGTTYEQDVQIDENILDVEWLEQPTLMFKYALQMAEARQRMDKAKDLCDLMRAELDTKIRKDPKEYELDKITETVVSSTILLQPEYQKAQENYLDAKYQFDVVRGAVDAINTRKDALENMVKLYGMQYFAGPKVPHNLTDIRKQRKAEAETSASNKVAKKLRRTTTNG